MATYSRQKQEKEITISDHELKDFKKGDRVKVISEVVGSYSFNGEEGKVMRVWPNFHNLSIVVSFDEAILVQEGIGLHQGMFAPKNLCPIACSKKHGSSA